MNKIQNELRTRNDKTDTYLTGRNNSYKY
jgi:hypothetical protein